MRKLAICGLLAMLVAELHASTLLYLSLDDMIRKSTLIVRGRPQAGYAALHGSIIYTFYHVQVTETLKGSPAQILDIGVPGGAYNGVRQTFAGAPSLVNGKDYVLFLWTGKSGLTQVIGLSQGLFAVTKNAYGDPMVVRAAASETMLNAYGQLVTDSDISLSLAALKARIQADSQ